MASLVLKSNFQLLLQAVRDNISMLSGGSVLFLILKYFKILTLKYFKIILNPQIENLCGLYFKNTYKYVRFLSNRTRIIYRSFK